MLFLEIKHWKSDKKRFSTLAWAAAPLEKLVDFGPTAARVRGCCRYSSVARRASSVSMQCGRGWLAAAEALPAAPVLQARSGPLDLPLFKKPLDASLRRTKRLTSRAFDLHLSVRGIE